MTWHTPQTFTADQLVDETDLNEDLRDNMNYLKQKMLSVLLFVDPAGLTATDPGTTYVDPGGSFANLDTKVDFGQVEGSIQTRIVVGGYGNDAGSDKGAAIYTTGGTKLCELEWNGTGVQIGVAGSWTALPGGVTADTRLELRVKGATATEDLVLHRVELQVKG